MTIEIFGVEKEFKLGHEVNFGGSKTPDYRPPVAAEDAAMSAALSNPLMDINALKEKIESGEMDFNLTFADNLEPKIHPYEFIGKDPESIANERAAEAILSAEVTPDNIFLKDLLRETNNFQVLGAMARFEQNYQQIKDIFEARIAAKEVDRSVVEQVMEGYDWFIQRAFTLGWIEDGTDYSERFGKEIFQAALEMTPTEFKEFLNTKLDEVESEGIYLGDNLNAYVDRLEKASKLGIDATANEAQALAILDFLTIFAGSPKFLKSLTGIPKGVLESVRVARLRAKNPIQKILTDPKSPEHMVESAASVASSAKTHAPNPSASAATSPKAISGQPSSPSHKATGIIQQIQETNEFVKKFFRGFDDLRIKSDVSEALNARLAALEDVVGKRVLRADPVRNLRNFDTITMSVDLGTASGKPFPSTRAGTPHGSATVLKRQIDEGLGTNTPVKTEIVKSDDGGWVVNLKQDLKESDFPLPSDIPVPSNQIAKVFYGTYMRYLGSTGGIDSATIAQAFDIREAALAKFVSEQQPVLMASQHKAGGQAAMVDEIIKYIWNGADSTKNKVWWNEDTLKASFRATYGEEITPGALEYYNTFRDLSDFAAYANASTLLKKYVERGYGKIISSKWNREFAARPINKNAAGKFTAVTSEDNILDLKADPSSRDLWVGAKRIKDVNVIYQIDEPFEVNGRKVRFVANPDEVTLLGLDDVHGYNAGPHRENIRARYFMVGTKADGTEPITFLTTSSKKEALEAQRQINTIKKADETNTLTDDVIRANNEWNPNIQSVKEWKDFAESRGISGRKINWKKRDEPVSFGLDREIWDNETFGTYVNKKHRGEVLTHYGGEATYNTDPFTALGRQLSSSLHKLAYNQQTLKQKRAFVEMVKRENDALGEGIALPKGVSEKNLYDIERIVNETKITGTTARHVALRNFQQAIWNRTSKSTFLDEALKTWGNSTMEYLYDATNLKFFQRQIVSGDPVTRGILTWNFHSTMGMGAIDQLFVQGMSAATAAAASPRYGISAIASQPLWQLMLHTGNMELRKGVAKVLEKLSMVTTRKIPADVWLQAADYQLRSGRNIVEHTSMELGTGAQLRMGPASFWGGAKSGLRSAAHVGAFPFRTGERISRGTANIIAHAEFRDMHPDIPWDAAEARRWISSREQGLLLHMNTGNHSAAQRGIAKIPLQWTSYMLRVTEAMATGGRMGLSPAERARIGFFLTAGMGIGSWGFDGAASGITEELGFDPGGDFYKFIQSGIIDGILNLAGANVSIADRVSLVAGYKQFFETYLESEGIETVGNLVIGPSSTVFVQDVWDALNVMGEFKTDGSVTFDVGTMNLLRTIKGVDNAMGALGVLQHGFYKSKTGKTFEAGEMGPEEAAMYLLGLKPYEHAELIRRTNNLFGRKRDFKELQKYYRKKFRNAINLSREGDLEGYSKMLREIIVEINTEANISSTERQRLRNMAFSEGKNELEDLYTDWFERGDIPSVRSTAEIMEGN